MRFPVLPLLVFLVLRLCFLATNFEATCVPNYELMPMGMLAWAEAEGIPNLGPVELYDNCGGHMVVGWIAGWLYALAGSYYAVLKLVPIGFGVGTLLLIWWSLQRHVSARSASRFAWLFAIGTPALLQASTLAMGNHYEGLFAHAVVWAAYLELRARPGVLRAAVFGLMIALGISFYFGTIVLASCCAVSLIWEHGKHALRLAVPALVACALGAIPLVWIEQSTGGRPSGFFAHILDGTWEPDLGRPVERMARFASEVLAAAASSPGVAGIPGRWFDLLFLGLGCLALACAALRVWRVTERFVILPLVLFLPGVVLAFSFSNLGFPEFGRPMEVVGRRYTYSMQLAVLILVSWLSASWSQGGRPWQARVGLTLTALVLLSGLGHIVPERWNLEHMRVYRGHHVPYVAGAMLRDAFDRPDLVKQRVEQLPAETHEEAYFGVGHHLGLIKLSGTPPGEMVATLSQILSPYGEAERPAIARGIGASLREWVPLGGAPTAKFKAAMEELSAHPGGLRDQVVRGLAMEFEFPTVRRAGANLRRTQRIAAALPEVLKPSLWSGYGRSCRQIMERGLPSDYAILKIEVKRVPERYELAFRAGVQEGQRP